MTPPPPPCADDAAFFENRVLFGHDPLSGIVAVEPDGPGRVRLWRRVDDALAEERDAHHPFLWVASEQLLAGGPPPREVRALRGGGALRFLATYETPEAWHSARRHVQAVSGELPGSPRAPYRALSDAVHQYLLASGRTFFKGLSFGDLHRLQLDIETYCAPDFEFSNPSREEDRVIAIAVSTNRGFETLLWGQDLTEREMLEALTALIHEHDPDVIEGHNLFRFDLDYLRARAARFKVKLAWGRDGSVPVVRPSRLQIAERTIDYPRCDIHGRHVLDTWILAHHYDVSHRNLPSYGLKDVARHFGLARADRVYVEGSRISWTWDNQPEVLREYCLDDVRETRALSDLLSPIYFLQAQMFPYSFQSVMVRGNATRIDAIFVREYLRRGWSLPLSAATAAPYAGGYADMFEEGVVGPVIHVDVQSLYPSLMLLYDLKPADDELDVFLSTLRDLRDFRLRAKRLAREATPRADYYDALQSTFKVLINSFYGYLGTTFCHFSDHAVAAEVTRRGRELIGQMIEWLRANGCRPVELDTDGIYFVPPGGDATASVQALLLEGLSRALPEGIVVEIGGCYPAMFSHKVKNYALLDGSGRVIVKGSGLKSRGLERYLRGFTESLIGCLLRGQGERIPLLLRRRLDDLAAHRVDIRDLCKTETLSESLEAYRAKVNARKRNASAVYELAAASGRTYRAGDSFSYYVAGKGKKVKVYVSSRPLGAWSATDPDENVEYYQQKLKDLVKKFAVYLPEAEPETEQKLLLEG